MPSEEIERLRASALTDPVSEDQHIEDVGRRVGLYYDTLLATSKMGSEQAFQIARDYSANYWTYQWAAGMGVELVIGDEE